MLQQVYRIGSGLSQALSMRAPEKDPTQQAPMRCGRGQTQALPKFVGGGQSQAPPKVNEITPEGGGDLPHYDNEASAQDKHIVGVEFAILRARPVVVPAARFTNSRVGR